MTQKPKDKKGIPKEMKLINISEVSRLLTGDRTAIRADYKQTSKHAPKLNRLKELVSIWLNEK